jgi:DNA-binding GntR family transcriptional regulator
MTRPLPHPNPPPGLPALKPVESITLREQVTHSVRTALMNGHFQPGQPVTVKALSTMLGASVMPAREAMNRLIAEGALELRANRSVIVPRLSRAEFEELTDLRCHIEAQAAARAIGAVGPDGIARLHALDAAMHAAADATDVDAYLDNNFKFHFLVYRAGASDFILSVIEKLWVRVGPLIRFCLNDKGFSHSGHMHQQLIRGLETGDRELVHEAIRTDISGAALAIRKAREAVSSWP